MGNLSKFGLLFALLVLIACVQQPPALIDKAPPELIEQCIQNCTEVTDMPMNCKDKCNKVAENGKEKLLTYLELINESPFTAINSFSCP